ncbi:hypothetical protein [Sorangium sp. So ce363]
MKRSQAVLCLTTQFPCRDLAQQWVKPSRSKVPGFGTLLSPDRG